MTFKKNSLFVWIFFFGADAERSKRNARYDPDVETMVLGQSGVLQCVAVCCSVYMTLKSRLWCSGSPVCCSMLHYVAVRCRICCSMLQCVYDSKVDTLVIAIITSQFAAVCCSMLQFAAAYCSMLQCVYDTEVYYLVHAIHQSTLETKVLGQLGMLQCMLQNVAVGRSMLQYVAVCFSLGMTPKSILSCLQST